MTGWGGEIGTKLETRHLIEKELKILLEAIKVGILRWFGNY